MNNYWDIWQLAANRAAIRSIELDIYDVASSLAATISNAAQAIGAETWLRSFEAVADPGI